MKHKEHYNDDYIFSFSQKILLVMPDFDEKAFCHSLVGRLDDKELFARFDYIVDAMQENMADYTSNTNGIIQSSAIQYGYFFSIAAAAHLK